jgi:hypothetical protein
MHPDENIVGTYRIGGPDERMDIYLAHPDLRGCFDQIEREETVGPSIADPSPLDFPGS